MFVHHFTLFLNNSTIQQQTETKSSHCFAAFDKQYHLHLAQFQPRLYYYRAFLFLSSINFTKKINKQLTFVLLYFECRTLTMRATCDGRTDGHTEWS